MTKDSWSRESSYRLRSRPRPLYILFEPGRMRSLVPSIVSDYLVQCFCPRYNSSRVIGFYSVIPVVLFITGVTYIYISLDSNTNICV